MFVYKLTCSKTGKVYYGATRKDPKIRLSKGHRKCSCKDFINPTLEIIEENIETQEQMYERENYYIKNYDCVNIKSKKDSKSKEYKQQYYIDWKTNNPEKYINYRLESHKPIVCDICGKITSKHSKSRHQKSIYCQKIKNENKILDNLNEHQQAEV